MKLTKAQRRTLKSISEMAVIRHFDVWGGYWWTERGKKLPRFGKSEHFPPLPIRYLLDGGLIAACENVRRASGYHEMLYEITPAGRAALEASNG